MHVFEGPTTHRRASYKIGSFKQLVPKSVTCWSFELARRTLVSSAIRHSSTESASMNCGLCGSASSYQLSCEEPSIHIQEAVKLMHACGEKLMKHDETCTIHSVGCELEGNVGVTSFAAQLPRQDGNARVGRRHPLRPPRQRGLDALHPCSGISALEAPAIGTGRCHDTTYPL